MKKEFILAVEWKERKGEGEKKKSFFLQQQNTI